MILARNDHSKYCDCTLILSSELDNLTCTIQNG